MVPFHQSQRAIFLRSADFTDPHHKRKSLHYLTLTLRLAYCFFNKPQRTFKTHVPLIWLKSTIAQVEKEQIKIVKDCIRSYNYNAGDLYSHSAVITRT